MNPPRAADRPLTGRNIALLHPAWHSCGTYRVVLGQIEAYRALGANVFPVAVATDPGFAPKHRWMWRGYVKMTPELDAGPRYFAGAPFHAVLAPRFLREVLWPYLHGDQARIRTGLISRSEPSPDLDSTAFDLVHCNHFFLMPVARRLARGAKILLDSHDLQARQFVLMNERMPWLKPLASFEEMLAQELDEMRGADLLIHLNEKEADEFKALLPEMNHALLYPAVPPAPTGPGGENVVIVSSNNSANVESVIWFLREVLPLAEGVTVKIAGSVDAGVKAREPALHKRHEASFLGRVDDLAEVYASAKCALLPTIDGHGLSIKSVEAMASGLPLVATSLAFRGMDAAAMALPGVTLAKTAAEFAEALRHAAKAAAPTAAERRTSAVRAFYEAHFSADAYRRNLLDLISPLMT